MMRPSLRPVLWVVLCLIPWAGLLAAEVLGITLALDFSALKRGGQIAWSGLGFFVHAGEIPRVAIAAMLAAMIHGGMAWKDELFRFAQHLKMRRGVVVRFLVHAFLFGGFVLLSILLATPGQDTGSEVSKLLATAWLLSAVAVGLSWFSIALPPWEWMPFLRRRGNSLLVGLGIGFVAWGAGIATAKLWKPMASATFEMVLVLISPFSSDLVYDPVEKVIGTGKFAVEIAPACSGYEGIGLVVVILGSYLWLCRGQLRFPQALLLLPVGTVLIWLTNSLRIALLIGVGNFLSPSIATGGFHSQAGWIALNAVTLGLILISRKIAWMQKEDLTEVPRFENSAAPYLVPLIVLVVLMMVGSAFSDGLDRLYFFRAAGTALALWAYRKSYRDIRIKSVLVAVASGILVLALWLLLEGDSHSSGEELTSRVHSLSPVSMWFWILARVVGSSLVVPFVEELAFRGFLARRIDSSDFEQVDPKQISIVAMIASSLVFGAMHQRFVAGTLAGLIYAFAYRFRGSLGDAILAHAITNGAIAALVLWGGCWYLWS